MKILTEADVASLLSLDDVRNAVEEGLRAQADGRVEQPLRIMAKASGGVLGAMPCSIDGVGLGAKLVTFFHENMAKHGLHTHHAAIVLFEPDTGVPAALIDGRWITETRTAATSAIATRALAGSRPSSVAILGTGVQAHAHIAALRSAGLLGDVRVWGRTPERAEQLAAHARAEGLSVRTAGSVAEACKGASVVCTVTAAREPILEAGHIEPGSHVNAVGSSTASMRELSPELVARTRIIVDTVEGARNESGDIIAAMRSGALTPQADLIRLCDVVSGKAAGRKSDDEITLFKSLGMALEDVACAALALRRARERGTGLTVEF